MQPPAVFGEPVDVAAHQRPAHRRAQGNEPALRGKPRLGFVQHGGARDRIGLARGVATKLGLDVPHTARLLAMTNEVGADAMIAMMNAKYHFLFWRPVTAIDPTSASVPIDASSSSATSVTITSPRSPDASAAASRMAASAPFMSYEPRP